MAAIPNTTPGLFVPHGRSIGGILMDVTIQEDERDELVITEHPIEQGAPIADHAFKRPSTVTIRAGWSVAKSGDISADPNGVYGLLLSWQAALQPFDLFTGKRSYKNMLMQSLSVTTDQTSEYALMASITCQQVILVGTKKENVPNGLSSNPDNHADPSSTAPTLEAGTFAPVQIAPSAESTIENTVELNSAGVEGGP